jgi:hypothetical protein
MWESFTDLGDEVGWTDKIDVMTTQALEFHHDFGQFRDGDFSAFSQMAYRVILAKKASQVAVGHKNRAGSLSSHQWAFFTKMRRKRTYFRKIAGFAEALFILGAVCTAIPRANAARYEHIASFLDYSRKFPFIVGFSVNRDKICVGHFN